MVAGGRHCARVNVVLKSWWVSRGVEGDEADIKAKRWLRAFTKQVYIGRCLGRSEMRSRR